MIPEYNYSDEDLRKRYEAFYGDEMVFAPGWIPSLRAKLSSLSEFVREIKVNFARYYNKRHHRRGYFWGDRFKSVIFEKGETLINCLAYIDLNPVRRFDGGHSSDLRFTKKFGQINSIHRLR
jgi:putative transposase